MVNRFSVQSNVQFSSVALTSNAHHSQPVLLPSVQKYVAQSWVPRLGAGLRMQFAQELRTQRPDSAGTSIVGP